MKQHILFAVLMLTVLMAPVAGWSDYIIHLKNGGRLTTPHYWREGGETLLYTDGCVVGMETRAIRRIEKTEEVFRRTPPVPAPVSVPEAVKESADAEKGEQSGEKPAKEERLDIEAYQKKMEALKARLNSTLPRIREAALARDEEALKAAREENRTISDEMQRLTEELKEKNKGQLPAGWWQGIGATEPAVKNKTYSRHNDEIFAHIPFLLS